MEDKGRLCYISNKRLSGVDVTYNDIYIIAIITMCKSIYLKYRRHNMIG